MLEKINILQILKEHIQTLKSYRSGKLHWPDIFLFFVAPAILTIFLLFFGAQLNFDTAVMLVTAMSIFSGLLFNLLLIVFDIAERTGNKKSAARIILRETYVNISFCLLLAIILIAILLVYVVIENLNISNRGLLLIKIISSRIPFLSGISHIIYTYLIPFLVFSFSILFLLTLLMVLKRIYTLLAKNFDGRL